jgi:exosortase/archaeosortase family protein
MEDEAINKPNIFPKRRDPSIALIGFLVIGLAVLPFIAAFNDLITNLAINIKAYKLLSDIVVPQQIRWVVTILRLLGVEANATKEYIILPMGGKNFLVELIWNCIGWQSLVMFILSGFIVIKGGFTWLSKIKSMLVGIIGTVFVNTFRIVIVILLYRFIGGSVAQIFHDYAALLTNTAWLLYYWKFSYKYILEEK